MKNMDDLWQVLLEDLRGRLSETAVNMWFGGVTAVAQEGDRFLLCCPNGFKREKLEEFFRPQLEQVLRERLSAGVEPVFLTEEEFNRRTAPSGRRSGGRFTFDSFVVGESNRMAFQTARAVAEGKNDYCNPLVIYGAPGLGKTHLLRAIEEAALERDPSARVISTKCEGFTNELVEAIRREDGAGFREKYRTADVFLMDDIQFLAGKKQTQEEFYNTFDALHQSGCSIVLTMDRPPKELERLERRLLNRFEGGLMVEIEAPDYDTRLAILRRKAEERGVTLRREEEEFIARTVAGSVRQLEGVLNQVKARGSAEFLGRAVEELSAEEERVCDPEEDIRRVAAAFGVEAALVMGKSHSKNAVAARQAAMFLLCRGRGLSTVQTGKVLGRDHTTVMHGLRAVEQRMVTDPAFAKAVEKLMAGRG